jgi:hypothetical protein
MSTQGPLPSAGSGPDPDESASYVCDDCGYPNLVNPIFSITGRCLCPGCADRRDAATCSLMAMSGIAGAAATGEWLRHRRHRSAAGGELRAR